MLIDHGYEVISHRMGIIACFQSGSVIYPSDFNSVHKYAEEPHRLYRTALRWVVGVIQGLFAMNAFWQD